jgi:geranylgeranyl pyrophosphate synthase
LGLAFQITDDILDVDEVSSEKRGSKGLINYVAVAGPAKAGERVKDSLQECLRAMQPYGGAAEPLREMARYVALRTTPVIDEDGTVPSVVSSDNASR